MGKCGIRCVFASELEFFRLVNPFPGSGHLCRLTEGSRRYAEVRATADLPPLVLFPLLLGGLLLQAGQAGYLESFFKETVYY